MGRRNRMANSDISRPPIVPAANGNQKPSRVSPIRKGMKPSTVDSAVSNTAVILALNALKYNLRKAMPG